MGCGALSGCDDQAQTVDERYFGVNAQFVRVQLSNGDLAGAEDQVRAIAETGVDFVRANVDWVSLEPAPPVAGRRSYDFAGSDRWVELLARHGLRWQLTGIGLTTPAWNREPEVATACAERAPAKAEAFASLMAALADRYGSSGSFWGEHPDLPKLPVSDFEVWNEPNFWPFWCPKPDPAAYAEMVVETDAAVEREDPAAQIVLGGLAGFTETNSKEVGSALSVSDFMELALEADPQLSEAIDQVGLHPYAEDVDGVVASLTRFRAELSALGIDAPIALNEIGWPTSGAGSGIPPLSEEARAAAVGSLTEEVAKLDCDVVSFAPHTWNTPEADPRDREHWFGIADPETAEPYPTALAYATEIKRLTHEGISDEPLPCSAP